MTWRTGPPIGSPPQSRTLPSARREPARAETVAHAAGREPQRGRAGRRAARRARRRACHRRCRPARWRGPRARPTSSRPPPAGLTAQVGEERQSDADPQGDHAEQHDEPAARAEGADPGGEQCAAPAASALVRVIGRRSRPCSGSRSVSALPPEGACLARLPEGACPCRRTAGRPPVTPPPGRRRSARRSGRHDRGRRRRVPVPDAGHAGARPAVVTAVPARHQRVARIVRVVGHVVGPPVAVPPALAVANGRIGVSARAGHLGDSRSAGPRPARAHFGSSSPPTRPRCRPRRVPGRNPVVRPEPCGTNEVRRSVAAAETTSSPTLGGAGGAGGRGRRGRGARGTPAARAVPRAEPGAAGSIGRRAAGVERAFQLAHVGEVRELASRFPEPDGRAGERDQRGDRAEPQPEAAIEVECPTGSGRPADG